jgi:hypothetical protein
MALSPVRPWESAVQPGPAGFRASAGWRTRGLRSLRGPWLRKAHAAGHPPPKRWKPWIDQTSSPGFAAHVREPF